MAVTATSSDQTLTLVKGDSDDILITVSLPDSAGVLQPINLSEAVDGTPARLAILRFAAKVEGDEEVPNAQALIYKTSHYADEIPFLSQAALTLGQARLLIDKPDTAGDDVDVTECYLWDLEVTQQDALRTGAQTGTIELQASPDGAVVLGTGTTFTRAKVGDVLQVLDGTHDGTPAIVAAIASDTAMTVSFTEWAAPASGLAFELRRGKHKTAKQGPFVLTQGKVKG